MLETNRLSCGQFQDHQQTKIAWKNRWRKPGQEPEAKHLLTEQTHFLDQLQLYPELHWGYSIGFAQPGRRWEGYFGIFYPQNRSKPPSVQPAMELIFPPIWEAAQLVFAQDIEKRFTDRQKDTLNLLMRGFTRTKIASTLGVTVDTTAEHVQNIFRHLNARKLSESVAVVTELKLF